MADDGVQLAPQSLRDLRDLGAAYKAGDKAIQKRMRDGLKDAAMPLGVDVVREGSEALPTKGGLRARAASARPGVTASLGGRTVSVSIRAANKQKDSLAGWDAGLVRHPVFKTGAWVTQRIRPHAYTDAFNKGAPKVRDKVNAAVQKALDDIAREA